MGPKLRRRTDDRSGHYAVGGQPCQGERPEKAVDYVLVSGIMTEVPGVARAAAGKGRAGLSPF